MSAASARAFICASSAGSSVWKPRWSMPGWLPRVEIAKLMRGSSSIHFA